MNCPTCHHEVAPDAHFCSRCGAGIVPPAAQPFQGAPIYPPLAYSRVGRHLQTLGMLWLIYAAWYTLHRIFGLTLLHGIFGRHNAFGMGPWFPFAVWPFAIGSTVLMLALCAITAYGLLNRQPWGRALGIVCAIFALIHPILGTALGIYTLWVLAPAVSGVEYTMLTQPARTA